jgi:hypothetical protein
MATRLRDTIESRGGFGAFFKLDPPAPTELEKFRQAWPAVAEKIGIKAEPGPPRLFELGECYYQRASDGVGIGPEIMRDLANRHATNADAQIDGDLVKSRFTLDPAVQNFWALPIAYDTCGITHGYRPTRVVDVVTSLGQRTTLLTIEKLPLV